MRAVRRILMLVALAGALASSSPPAHAAAVPVDGYGASMAAPFLRPQSEADTVRELDAARRAGLRYIRIALRWDQLEPGGPGQWDGSKLAELDRVVDLARARGIQTVPIFLYAPAWSRSPLSSFSSPPTDPGALGGFAGRLAAHLGTRVSAYEVWNEPNLPIFWGGPADPAGYTALLKATYPPIKRANPAATVIAAALSPEGDGLLSMAPSTFYRGIYRAGGKGFFDAAAAHPYTWGKADAWTADVDAIRALMVQNGDGGKKIWITENGISTATLAPGTSEAGQRGYVLDALEQAARRPFVGPTIFYSLRDTGSDRADRESNFGLLRLDFSPKPALDALAALTPAAPPPAGPAPAPTTTPCRSTRRVTVRLRRLARGQRYVRVTVTVHGKRARSTKGRRLRTARVDLRGLAAGRHRVRIVARTATGRTVRLTRTYRTCGAVGRG